MPRCAYFEAVHVTDSEPPVWLLMLEKRDGTFAEVQRWYDEPTLAEIGSACVLAKPLLDTLCAVDENFSVDDEAAKR